MHQNVEEANLVPIDPGWNGYIARIPHHPNPKPQHTQISGGGGGEKKRVPKGCIAACKGVECEKVVNTITMNCLCCLLSGFFLTPATGRTAGAAGV